MASGSRLTLKVRLARRLSPVAAALLMLTATAPAAAGEFTLRVLSYNINGLPLGLSDSTRYADVGRILKRWRREGTAPHVVLIQEAFEGRTREVALEAGYPVAIRGTPAGRVKANGGLMILSEFPVERAMTVVFENCLSHDCLSRKGAMIARLRVPELPFPLDVATAHLNSSYQAHPRDLYDQTRIGQTQEAWRLIRHFNQIQPAEEPPVRIFAGDFNFHPGDTAYEVFLRESGMENAGEVCSRTGCPTGSPRDDTRRVWQRSVDHHFFGPEPGAGHDMEAVFFTLRFRDPVRGRLLSDHRGKEFHYRIRW